MLRTKHPLYSTWLGIRSRCTKPNSPAYRYYGGRGITVCDRWARSFLAFVEDMGERPDGYTIERINNDGNYEPTNCRWATRKEQMTNQRITRKVVIEGITYKAHKLAELTGLKTDTIVERAAKYKTLAEVVADTRYVFHQGLAMSPNRRSNTHCRHGHEYTPENTYWTHAGYRQCRACNTRNDKKRRGPRSKIAPTSKGPK